MRHIEQRQAIAGLPAALRVLRAPQWLHFAVLPLAGMDRATLASPPGLARSAVAVLTASLALGYAYGVNALGDRASDASAVKNPLAGVARVPLDTKIVIAGAALAALSISLLLGPAALVLVL